MYVRVGHKEGWVPKNSCFWTVVLEKTLESPLDCKEIQPVRSEGDQPWDFFGRNDAKAETLILWPSDATSWLHLKRPWCWERLKAGGEGDNRGWDGWMALPTQWTWVWVNLGSWWWTGRPGVLQSVGSQRVGHDWTTDLNWTEAFLICSLKHGFIQSFGRTVFHYEHKPGLWSWTTIPAPPYTEWKRRWKALRVKFPQL